MEDIFGKKEIREDKIKPLIEKMNELSDKQEYEKANEVLISIKEELKKEEKGYLHIGDVQTIKDVYNLVVSNVIRINPDNYTFAEFLNLMVSVHNRKNELQGAMYSNIQRQRKVVAEEMVCNGLTIPQKKRGVSIKKTPNRAFMDIAFRVNPSICRVELKRKAVVEMWKAIEKRDTKKIEKARENLKKYQ